MEGYRYSCFMNNESHHCRLHEAQEHLTNMYMLLRNICKVLVCGSQPFFDNAVMNSAAFVQLELSAYRRVEGLQKH